MSCYETGPMYLVYADVDGKLHYQSWDSVDMDGPLIDNETREYMDVVGWTTEKP